MKLLRAEKMDGWPMTVRIVRILWRNEYSNGSVQRAWMQEMIYKKVSWKKKAGMGILRS